MESIKDIANKMDVSKTTVTRYIKLIEQAKGKSYINENTTKELNRMYLSDELAAQIMSMIEDKQSSSWGELIKKASCSTETEQPRENTTPQQENCNTATKTATSQQKCCNTASETATPQQEKTIETMQALIDALTEQLQVKDKQISDLLTALNAAQTLQAMQYKQLEDRQAEQKPKGLLNRIFKKKDAEQ